MTTEGFAALPMAPKAGYEKLSVTTVHSLNEVAHTEKNQIFIACVTRPNDCEQRDVVVLKHCLLNMLNPR